MGSVAVSRIGSSLQPPFGQQQRNGPGQPAGDARGDLDEPGLIAGEYRVLLRLQYKEDGDGHEPVENNRASQREASDHPPSVLDKSAAPSHHESVRVMPSHSRAIMTLLTLITGPNGVVA